MISGPSPLDDTVQVHYVYDAWNRLVAVYADDSGEPGDLMAQYEYDGFNQRIVKTVYDGEDTTTSEYFYNESWQLLAARTTAGEDTSATHYVWDLSYVDAPITRLFDANADGDFTDAGDAAYYYTFDANQNVTALLGPGGNRPGRVRVAGDRALRLHGLRHCDRLRRRLDHLRVGHDRRCALRRLLLRRRDRSLPRPQPPVRSLPRRLHHPRPHRLCGGRRESLPVCRE